MDKYSITNIYITKSGLEMQIQILAWLVVYNNLVSTPETQNTLIVVGFLIITACTLYITYYLVKALKSITNLADSLVNTTQDIKNKIQMRTLIAIPALLVALVSKILRRR